MVDSISSFSAKGRIERPGGAETNVKGAGKANAAAATGNLGSADEVSLSQAAKALPAALEVGPPFDLESVSRIKKAISEGKYPIDYERITDSLFENYRELML